MSENPKELPRLEAELSVHDMAVAITEFLIKWRAWPEGVHYDHTVLTVGLGGAPTVFSAQIGPLLPEAPRLGDDPKPEVAS